MNWQRYLTTNRVRAHTTSLAEIDALRSVVARDLGDAALGDLSSDRAFATAYNAALQLTKMAIACAGYRVVGVGAHQTSFEVLELALGPAAGRFAAYFETCRRKRNTMDYDAAYLISQGEAAEILRKVREFEREVEAWIARLHPQYIR